MNPVEIREADDGPRLHGVLIQEGRAASGGRAEVFTPHSVEWPDTGVGILLAHRQAPEVRAPATREPDGRIMVTAPATAGIRAAVAGGKRYMSVEFHSLEERTTRGGVREIQRALVIDAALVTEPEYDVTRAEIRARSGGFRTAMKTRSPMDCKCPDGLDEVEFGDTAFDGVESYDVTAISRGAESVLASTSTGTLRLRQGRGGNLEIDATLLDTEAGRRTSELLDAELPVYARPLWDMDRSEWVAEGSRAVVSSAWFQYVLVRPVPDADSGGIDPVTVLEGRSVAPPQRRRFWL